MNYAYMWEKKEIRARADSVVTFALVHQINKVAGNERDIDQRRQNRCTTRRALNISAIFPENRIP
jgi:hypothetical protein